MAIPVENFYLDTNFQGTLQARIQQMIAQGILIGRFRTGERLPSTRALARHLKVSRLTVTLAYTELLASDYITSRDRSGYFVSDTAPEATQYSTPIEPTDAIDWTRAIGQKFTGGSWPEKPQNWATFKYPFIYGQTDPKCIRARSVAGMCQYDLTISIE